MSSQIRIYDSASATNKTALNLGLGDNASEDYNLNQITLVLEWGEDLIAILLKQDITHSLPIQWIYRFLSLEKWTNKNRYRKYTWDVNYSRRCRHWNTNPSAPLSICGSDSTGNTSQALVFIWEFMMDNIHI